MKKTKSNKREWRYAVFGCSNWGLYYGKTDRTDEELAATRDANGMVVTVHECRHVRYWYGKTGGITSLAAHGPCGSRKSQSRIGAPSPSSLIPQIKAIHYCTPEAIANFASVPVSDT